ncbi:MAG TPA: hypothetical protein VK530_00630, partial [Candidatus Acidoferrum sp.]|nr:hypothetical protein [Candidatus Acidoferrum sp.]
SSNPYSMPNVRAGEWRSAAVLESMGISSLNTARVIEQLNHEYGGKVPATLHDELTLTRAALMNFWRRPRSSANNRHVFVGPPGSGKTTVLCKWLTQAVLMDAASARVWRLDVPRANTAEALSVHCEILNVPLVRAWSPDATGVEDHGFIDVPGVDPGDEAAMAELETMLSTMPGASVSLVLNAAYDTALLQKQVRAFSRLPITDLIFTHLDEEARWSKLWNFVLGTNCSLSFLSAGQNIPGHFMRATPDALFPAAFTRFNAPSTVRRTVAEPVLITQETE